MITDTFENLSEEIIKVSCNDNAVKVDACILTFSHVILKYVLDNFECKKLEIYSLPMGRILFMDLSTRIDILQYICLILEHLHAWQI